MILRYYKSYLTRLLFPIEKISQELPCPLPIVQVISREKESTDFVNVWLPKRDARSSMHAVVKAVNVCPFKKLIGSKAF